MLNNLQQSGDCRPSVWSHQLGFNGCLVIGSSVPLFSALVVEFVGSLEMHLIGDLGFWFSELILAAFLIQSYSFMCYTNAFASVLQKRKNDRQGGW